MKGNAKVIKRLNEVLTNELTAIDQYFLHAKMFAHWGFARLAAHERKDSLDEMKHAEELMERILSSRVCPISRICTSSSSVRTCRKRSHAISSSKWRHTPLLRVASPMPRPAAT